MTEAIEELCGKMTLTEGESVGLTISEDDTADIGCKVSGVLWGNFSLIGFFREKLFAR
jgi:hypothetical protein